jgi:hypothetical protein
MDLKQCTADIIEKLKAAKEKGVWPFGAAIHCFRLEPVAAESEVVKFEARWRIRLPEEYRAFITLAGDGGAGPAYGLFPLEETVSCRGTQIPAGLLQKPFPFLAAYNPREDPKMFDYWQRSKSRKVTTQEHEARKLKEIAGTLPLCHEGCGDFHLLVVSGAARGQMWLDATVSDGGYWPLSVGFLDWYVRWLDGALAGGDGAWWLHEAVK